jgi:dienelactone hydrolase
MNRLRTALPAVAICAVLLATLTSCQQPHGPDPTLASISATTGPFAIATTTVPAGNGFGGATIYYPTDSAAGPYGGVAVVPGYTARQSSISWYGPRVASQGFVVMTIDTITTTDPPNARGDQLLAALDYLTTSSSVKSLVNPNRLAVMGWSMGGGGTFFAAKKRPSLKAIVPLAPWSGVTDFSMVHTPTLVVACQNDNVAPTASYAKPLYNSDAGEKAYLEITGGDHYCVTSPNTTIARSVISWLKRWVDEDTRYGQFLCPPPTGSGISDYQSTCPY